MYDLRDGSSVPITSAGTRVGFPSWVPPEGDRISFLGPVGDRQLYRTFWSSSRGGGELERLTEEVPGLTASQGGGSWSLDGRYFVFSWQTEGPRRGADLYVVDMDDGGLPERLTEGTHYAPAISPDGRWIAHSSRETGREEISVRRFPEGSNPVQVSRGGGRSPLWAPDMSELYYREGSVLVAVRVETEPDFSMLDRRVLFDGPYLAELEGPSYDVHPSGDSFAMTKLEPWEARLVLVQNFFEELKRLVPN